MNILLSVRDGADYLDALIASVRDQDYTNWSLLIANDGSVDATERIVAHHAALDGRIHVVVTRRESEAIGPSRSFMELLGHVPVDEVFAFCDQDDVWFAHKLSWTVEALIRLQSVSDIAAVATDAVVTDPSLDVIAPSALALHHVDDSVSLGRLFVNNVAIGATLCGTGELARVAHETGRDVDVRMHDWWCVLVAAYAGSFELLAAPTMYWRRHDATVTGARPKTFEARVARRLATLDWSRAAARALIDHVPPIDERAAKVAAAMAAVSERTPTATELWRLRRRGIRAWSVRHDAHVLGAVLLRPVVRICRTR